MTVDVSTAVLSPEPVRTGVVRAVLHDPLAMVSAVILLGMVILSVIQEWTAPFSPQHVELNLTNARPFTSHYLLGGDQFGRDILSRLIAGTRGGLVAGVTLAAVALLVGVSAGLVAGYFGQLFDAASSWVFSVLIAAPGIIILIALYTLVGVSMPIAMAVLGVLTSPGIFLLVRSLTRSVRNELYVDAARVAGLSDARIVGRHVLLVIKGPIVVLAAFLAGGAIAISAGLEFLGLGDPTQPSWGGMLNDAFNNYFVAPWQLIWPGAALGLATGAFVLLGNALRDALEGSALKATARARRGRLADHVGDSRATAPVGAGRPAEQADDTVPLLEIVGLEVAYPTGNGVRTVIEGVSLRLDEGEVVGLVGESGSGKTQTVFAALGVLPDQAVITRGSVRFEGVELLGLSEGRMAEYRGDHIAYVPQEPMSNLDPSFTVGSQLIEGIRVRNTISRRAATEQALAMLRRVGIADPQRTFRSYPHEISGGMAQRVLIAGAVIRRPRLLIADEPTTALDVTVQAEVLDLLRGLQKEFRMSVLIVTHNFGVVADLCDRVIVMRTGKIVEDGAVTDVFAHPRHEYTQMLLASILDERATRRSVGSDRG